MEVIVGTREEFRTRVEAAFEYETGGRQTILDAGAAGWFQKKAGIKHRNTVSRWLRDGYESYEPPRWAWLVLATIEHEQERD